MIERNWFNHNRHSIAGTGKPGCGYLACHNVEAGTSLSHCFDMHGGRDRKDGTDTAGTDFYSAKTNRRVIIFNGLVDFKSFRRLIKLFQYLPGPRPGGINDSPGLIRALRRCNMPQTFFKLGLFRRTAGFNLGAALCGIHGIQHDQPRILHPAIPIGKALLILLGERRAVRACQQLFKMRARQGGFTAQNII